LNQWRHDQDGLRPTVAHRDVGQVKQRRTVRRPGVHDLEYGLQVAIQVDRWPRVAFEHEWLIAVIPPSVWNPAGEPHGLARSDAQPLTIDLRRQCAFHDQPLFILEMMDVQGWALSMRGESSPQCEHRCSVVQLTSDFENLTGVSIRQTQGRGSHRDHASN
jgi:hypothetical protein